MQSRLVLFLIIIAVILAIFFFLFVTLVLRGPADDTVDVPGGEATLQTGENDLPGLPPAGIPYPIDGTTVYLAPAAGRSVRLKVPEVVQPDTPTETPDPVAVATATTAPTVAVQPTLAPVATTAPAPATQSVVFIAYTVQPGDTLYRIADTQATSIELMSVHGIDADDLVPGNTLQLPVANSGYCPGMRTYVVRPGDNVFRIGLNFGVDKDVIAQANNLVNYRINIAQVLCIP
jgi:LysM repeat protein